jgi:hypothetical protein
MLQDGKRISLFVAFCTCFTVFFALGSYKPWQLAQAASYYQFSKSIVLAK